MQSVRQLDQNDPDISGHGQKHLAQVLRLPLQLLRITIPVTAVISMKIDLLQFRDPVHQKRHIRPKLFLDLFVRHDGVFHHIMQKPRYDRLLVKLQVRQYDRHIKRVYDIGFSRFAYLPPVRVVSRLICLLDQRDIIGRMIFAHTVNKLLVQSLGRLKFLNRFNSAIINDDFFLFFCRHSLSSHSALFMT